MSPISFKANYKHSVEIQKYNGKEYTPYTAAFVELETSERPVIKNVYDKWNTPLVSGIYKAFVPNSDLKHVYAVTTQTDCFDKLDSNKILGMALFEEHNKNYLTPEISYFQVHPQNLSEKYGTTFTKLKKYFSKIFRHNKSSNNKPQYKHIGESLMSSLQNLHNDKTIIVHSLSEAEGFYKKMGYKKLGVFMVWSKK